MCAQEVGDGRVGKLSAKRTLLFGILSSGLTMDTAETTTSQIPNPKVFFQEVGILKGFEPNIYYHLFQVILFSSMSGNSVSSEPAEWSSARKGPHKISQCIRKAFLKEDTQSGRIMAVLKRFKTVIRHDVPLNALTQIQALPRRFVAPAKAVLLSLMELHTPFSDAIDPSILKLRGYLSKSCERWKVVLLFAGTWWRHKLRHVGQYKS